VNQNPRCWTGGIICAIRESEFLLADIMRIINRKHWRWISIWFGSSVWLNVSYRFDRVLFLLIGRLYPAIRPAFVPVFLVFAAIGGRHEIHYRARIGPGLIILHSALGIVISGQTVAGENLTLIGGNLIGSRKPTVEGEICIGSRVTLGANAVVLGPIKVCDDVFVGAGAVVIEDVTAGAVVGGVPAKVLSRRG
jgi:serine O-acetyltransferase